MPEISVIVPVYKAEDYLHACVDSILSQTVSDFELILVDDGSPDGCGAICDDYAARDSRVRVIHQENGGHGEGVNQSFGGVRAQVAGEQRTVRQRELQVPGDQNRLQRLPFTGMTADDHGDRGHSWQFELLQSTQDLVLSLGHLARDLLHGVHLVAHVHESHDVAGDASRQVGQQVLRPGGQGLVNIFGFELAAVIFSACGSAELACSSSALTDVAFSARGSIWGNSFNSMCSILRVVRDVCSFATTSARYVYGRFNSPHAAHCISLDLVCCASCKRSSSICRCRLSI